jgi:hypothetical protein
VDRGSRSGDGNGYAAGGAPDEPVLVALGAGAEPAAALEAVPLVAAVAGAAKQVSLAAAAGAAAVERGAGSGGDDAAELPGLVEAPDLVGAAEVAAADEDLGQRHAGEERGELGQVAGVHGEVALVDGRAEPAQDGAHRAAVLVGAADDAEGREVQHHPPAARHRLLASGRRRRPGRGLVERAEGPERGGGDADAVQDARRRGGGGRGCGGGVRRQQRPEVLERRVGDGEAWGRAGACGGDEGCGGGGGGGVRAVRLHPGRPHEDRRGAVVRAQAGGASGTGTAALLLLCFARLQLCVVSRGEDWGVGFMRWEYGTSFRPTKPQRASPLKQLLSIRLIYSRSLPQSRTPLRCGLPSPRQPALHTPSSVLAASSLLTGGSNKVVGPPNQGPEQVESRHTRQPVAMPIRTQENSENVAEQVESRRSGTCKAGEEIWSERRSSQAKPAGPRWKAGRVVRAMQ